MSLRSTPAAGPAAGFLAGVAGGSGLAVVPVPLAAALAALGLAWGGARGRTLAALACGLLLGVAGREQAPADDRDRVVEAAGRICGFWRERDLFATRSVRFCPDWLRQGEMLLSRPPRLRLECPVELAAVPYGARLVVRGSLSRFAGLANEAETPPGPWRLRVKSAHHLRRLGAPGPLARAVEGVRTRIFRALDAAGTGRRDGVALARALVLGDESGLDEERTRALRRAGLAHLLAVSGFNVTLLAALAALLAGGSAPWPRRWAPAVSIALYLAAVGPEPSLVRASWMAGAALAALALGRPAAALQALALSAALLVAWDPAALAEAGFRLSFGATLALLLLAERWAAALEGWPRPAARALAASFAAQVGTLPWSVEAFAELAPAAPLWNLVAVPWAALWMVVGLAWILVALVWPPLAGALAPLLDLGVAPFAALERLPPSPWVSSWLPGGWLGGAAVAAGIAIAFEARRARGALLLGALALAVAPATAPDGEAEAIFVDVGQGDAAIVRGGGATLLVDGGGLRGRDLGAAALRPLLARRGVRRVDAALLSHADTDHCLGLLDLAAQVAIEEVWLPPGAERVECAERLARRARRGVLVLRAGASLRRGAIRLRVLHPASPAGDGNRDSLVVAVTLAGRRLLFTGDLPAAEERRLARAAPELLRADLLKVAHHGSAGSSDRELLERVAPRLAVVSAGTRNAFGHPSPAALARLAAAGARIARTDRDGEIVLRWRAGGPWRIALPGSPRRVEAER